MLVKRKVKLEGVEVQRYQPSISLLHQLRLHIYGYQALAHRHESSLSRPHPFPSQRIIATKPITLLQQPRESVPKPSYAKHASMHLDAKQSALPPRKKGLPSAPLRSLGRFWRDVNARAEMAGLGGTRPLEISHHNLMGDAGEMIICGVLGSGMVSFSGWNNHRGW